MASVVRIDSKRPPTPSPAGHSSAGPTGLPGHRSGLPASEFNSQREVLPSFEALRQKLAAELSPRGSAEGVVFNDLVHAAWHLNFFRRLELDAVSGSLDLLDLETADVLEVLGRHHARLQRAFHGALGQLRKLQGARLHRTGAPAGAARHGVPAMAG